MAHLRGKWSVELFSEFSLDEWGHNISLRITNREPPQYIFGHQTLNRSPVSKTQERVAPPIKPLP